MLGLSSPDPRSPPKRLFEDFDELDRSSPRPGTKRLRIETEEIKQETKIVQTVQTVQQQPKPLPLKRPRASFLENFTDPLFSNPPSTKYYGEFIPRRLTKSAPDMEYKDGFAVPPTPASTQSRKCRTETEGDSTLVSPSDISSVFTGSSRNCLVEDPLYRINNLAENNIHLRSVYDEFPEDIAKFIDYIRRDRDSQDLSLDQAKPNLHLEQLEFGPREIDCKGWTWEGRPQQRIPFLIAINVLNWCCGIAGASCAASLQVAVMPGTVLGVAASTQTVTWTASSSGSSSTDSSESSAITPASEMTTTITSAGATIIATYGIGQAACAAFATETGVTAREPGCTVAHDVAIGAGVGVPLGVALVAVSAVLAMYVRRSGIKDEKAPIWPEYTSQPWGKERIELEKARQHSNRSEMDGEDPPPPTPREIDGKSVYGQPPRKNRTEGRSRSGGFSLLSESPRAAGSNIGPFDFRSLMTGGTRSSRATSHT
ncbi:hypothetical protein B7494_g6907 [Chlorociboria aeruginascens]|nr:hypothetical protein B7494_g6907 [Chlorociboria aeruginascens]